jgi:serine/threonine protein kinase
MPLMKGNLKTLVEKATVPDEHALSDTVLRQMLLALECIASHNIIHRDVKPENILWEHDPSSPSPENYRFCLGDFGLSNDPTLACTAAATEPFMAPEVFHRKRQTAKVDIWSLFATIVWTRTPEFRRACSQMRAPDLHVWLVDFSRTELYANIRRMASMDPVKRPSATKQLALLEAPAQAPFEQDYAGSMHVGSYGSNTSRASGDEAGALGGNLAARFSRGLTLQDNNINMPGLTYGSGSSEAVTSPELPYYEPYASGLMQTYFGAQAAGPSKGYMPPSPDPADAPRNYGVCLVILS